MKFGDVKLGGKLGGYTIVNQPADKLPQDLATAIPDLCPGYIPLWYMGTQLVNGMNHAVVCSRNNASEIVLVIINIPPNSVGGKGASVVSITDSADLFGTLGQIFTEALNGLVGVTYKPIAFLGEQVVKGVNYFILAEAKIVYPDAKPYPAIVEINVFQNKASLVGIERLGGLGYSFSW